MIFRSYHLQTLLLAALSCAAAAFAAETNSPPPCEIRFIPEQDLSRAEGYSASGTFLPLARLLELVRAADTGAPSAVAPGSVTCFKITLAGSLKPEDGSEGIADALKLDGAIEFDAPSAIWSATLIDDGAMPWTSQSFKPEKDAGSNSGVSAFLARVEGKTWLFARGPGRGSIRTEALLPVAFETSSEALRFGAFFAPCLIQIALPGGVRFDTANVPAEVRAETGDARLWIWPSQRIPAEAKFRRSIPFAGPTALRAQDNLIVAAVGANVAVAHHLYLEDRFTSSTVIRLAAPSGLRLVRAESADPCVIETAGDAFTIRPTQECSKIEIVAEYAADLKEGRLSIGSLAISAAAIRSTLTLQGDNASAPVLDRIPDGLVAVDALVTGTRNYELWGALPPLEVSLVPLSAAEPPKIETELELEPGEASARYQIRIPPSGLNEFVFSAPAGWTLIDLEARAAGTILPTSIQPQKDSRWRVSWSADAPPPEILAFTLHRNGGWGGAGGEESLPLPIVSTSGPRVTSYEMRIAWPDQFDVQTDNLAGLSLVPLSEASGSFSNPSLPVRSALRANAGDPSGVLKIRGRAADARASVVTVLNVAEDRTTVRAQITYTVQFAASNTFKFVLPAGTGAGVRIDGEGIRETTMRPIKEGEEWTVVTQQGVIGDFAVRVEWTLTQGQAAAGGAILAPRILLPEVSSQKGFILLEGSETMQIEPEAKNLAEADLAEVPPHPWTGKARVLAAYRYVEPRFELRLRAEKFKTERGIAGLAREAKLTTTVSPEGDRFTRARYLAPASGGSQFFEIRPPKSAEIWATLVNGHGAKPARRLGENGETILMIPLPPAPGQTGDFSVEVLYRETGEALDKLRRLDIEGPKLSIPINRTTWDLNLPQGFEYLAYGGTLGNWATVRQPLITFLRTAYYPREIVLQGWSLKGILILTLVVLGLWAGFRKLRGSSRRVHITIIELLVVFAIIAILAAISVPNFLEAQVRSKVSRVKADERSLATAIESYYVNTGFYPTQLDVLWQGPVKYMSSPFADPYGSGGGSGSGYGAASSYRYLSGSEAYEKAARAGLVPPGKTAEANPNFWMAYSVGPDGRDDGGEVIYDPTNGSTSAGDIIRIGENESNEAYERPVPPSQNQLSQAYQRAAQTSSNVPEAGVEAAPLDADQKKLQESLGNSFTPEQIKIIQELIQAKLRDNNPAESPAAASPALANRVVDLEKQLRTLGVDVGKVNEQLDKFTDERETEARTRVNVAQLFREANTLSQVKKYDEAIIKIREILNLDSNNQLALQRLRVLEDMAAGKTTMDNLNEKRDSEIQQQYEQLKADALRNENRNTLASLTAAKVTWQMIKSMKIDYVEEATRMIALLDRKIERLAGKPAKIGGQDGGMQPLMKAGIGREEMMKQSGASRNLNMSPAPSVLDESNPQGVVTFYASDGATHGLGQSVVVYTANDSSDSLSGGMENLFEFDFSADANKRVGHSLSAGGDYIVGDLEEGAKNNVFGSSDALRFDEIVADDNSPDSGIIWSYDNAGLYRIGKTSRLGRKAGLLSLGIELPEGGVQRIFEGLTGDARVEVRLMAEKRFLRLAFIVWMGVFLGLGWVWFRRRERYRPALLAAILVSLLTPLIVENSYAAFFNAAFQGAVLSLILPLAFRLKRRVVPSGGSTAAAALMFAILAGLPSRVRGESTTADVNEPMEKRPPVRILVPYGDDIPTSPVLRLQSNDGPTTSPMAFISRDDFGRLWNAAHPISARLPGPGGAIQSLYLEGDLSPETASIKGTLLIRAANPDDRPTSVALRMEGLKIDSAPAGEIAPNNPLPAGTGLIYAEDGLRLSLAPQWSGELKASFNLPCRMNGASGSFSLQFPEVATGLWRVTLPYDASVQRQNGSYLSRKISGGTLLTGVIRSGELDVLWNAARGTESAAAPSDQSWRGTNEIRFTWESLDCARWSALLTLEAPAGGASLPAEIKFSADPSMSFLDAEGDALAAAEAAKDGLTLKLNPAREARISLSGLLLPTNGAWKISALNPSGTAEIKGKITFDVSDAIETVSIKAAALDRRPSRETRQGFSTQSYESSGSDWNAMLELRRLEATFDADVTELLAPGEGILRQAGRVVITPHASRVRECVLALPAGLRVTLLQSGQPITWIQNSAMVSVMFEPAIDSAAQIEFTALDDSASASGEINLTPLRVVNARETRRSAALAISDDIELREIELAGAQARAPGQIEEELLALMFGDAKSRPGRLRPYLLKSDVALKFGMVQVADSRPLVNVFNRVTLGEELETLQTVVTAKPRQGRIREIGVRLLLPSPDPGAAARLKTSGPVRRTRVEPDGDAALRITAELDAPSAQTVSVSFSLDQPLNAAAGTAPRAAVMLPSETDGARSFLLIHRAFEGELSPLDLAGGRAADPAEIAWPDANFGFLPSDLVYELSSGAKAGPSFSIQRHARQATLHAVVESLRNRTIITPDGVERNELEIVLQNESEQFLKVALPYERSRVTLYETLVAGKSVRTAFVKEGNREALAIPLIRTGLLEPELTVRVAYTVTGGAPMKRSGRREQRLPDILGGVPVTESALVLMLPSEFDYDKFEGSLDQVELVDLELDEAARKARTSEKLSQAALYSTGEVQRAAYSKLNDYQTAVNSEIKSAKTTYGAQSRMGQTIGVGGGTKGQAFQRAREAKLGTERAQKLKQAETSALNGVSNLSQIAQNVGGQTLNVAGSSDQEAGNITAPSPAIPRPGQAFTILPTTTPALEFPRVGDVFVFRQLQGTGAINFKYSSRETSGRRSDSLLGIGLVILAAGLIYRGGAIMATRRRVALAIMLPALAALAFGVLIDLAVPILIAGIILLMRRPPSSRTA